MPHMTEDFSRCQCSTKNDTHFNLAHQNCGWTCAPWRTSAIVLWNYQTYCSRGMGHHHDQFSGTCVGRASFFKFRSSLSVILRQDSVIMTLSKMVLPFTCHRSKPMKPKSSYLYLGFSWIFAQGAKHAAYVHSILHIRLFKFSNMGQHEKVSNGEHTIVELLVGVVLLPNHKPFHTNTSALSCYNSILSYSQFESIWDGCHIPDLKRT